MPPAQQADIRPLDPISSRTAVAELLTQAQDYDHFWLGHAPGAAEVDDIFTAGPPGCDPVKSHRLGLYLNDQMAGVAELSFGFPKPEAACGNRDGNIEQRPGLGRFR